MRRRAYLTAVGSGLAVLGGCSGGDGETAPTTREQTPESTPEPTPESTPVPSPSVTEAGLLLDRDEFSALNSDIESVGEGGEAIVGAAFEMPAGGGSVRGLVEATVSDSENSEVTSNTSDISAVVDEGQQYQRRTVWFAFDTESWDRERHTAELSITDESYGTTADPRTVEFDVVEPLGEGEVEIEQVDPADQIFVDEEYTMEFTATNVSERDSSLVVDTVTLEYEGRDAQFDYLITENIPVDGSVTVTIEELSFNVPGRYTFRLPEQDAEFVFTVEER